MRKVRVIATWLELIHFMQHLIHGCMFAIKRKILKENIDHIEMKKFYREKRRISMKIWKQHDLFDIVFAYSYPYSDYQIHKKNSVTRQMMNVRCDVCAHWIKME